MKMLAMWNFHMREKYLWKKLGEGHMKGVYFINIYSDAHFSGLSLGNCTCTSGWSSIFEPWSKLGDSSTLNSHC